MGVDLLGALSWQCLQTVVAIAENHNGGGSSLVALQCSAVHIAAGGLHCAGCLLGPALRGLIGLRW